MKTAFSARMAQCIAEFRRNKEYRDAERSAYARFLDRGRHQATGILLPSKEERHKAKKA